ncbi:MAG: DUF3786 domain-containing protein [Chloroflexi bacterium]|nr:DUF3786 domain-containing protein [Chloroflexota bacterium]
MPEPQGDTPRQRRALALARERLSRLDPMLVAARAGVPYVADQGQGGFWRVPFLGRVYRVSYPEGSVEDIGTGKPPHHAANLILLHYLAQADGAPVAGKWMAFRELPDGLIYHRAFVGRVEPPLVSVFGQRPERLLHAGRLLGGMALTFGDSSVSVDVLPRIRLACILYGGDEEFPPSAQVLFDAAAGHYLPIEDLAVLGGLFVGALCKAALRIEKDSIDVTNTNEG